MRRLLLSLIAGAAVAMAAVFFFRARSHQSAPAAASSPPGALPASAAAALAAGAPRPKPGDPVIIRDAAAVFQRAFWRRPSSDVRILDGERREWLDAHSAVQKWQWFVAVETSAEFRAWLLEQNPFDLGQATTPIESAGFADAPAWFPPASRWLALTAYRTRGNQLVVLLDPASGQLFASGHGGGFAAPVR